VRLLGKKKLPPFSPCKKIVGKAIRKTKKSEKKNQKNCGPFNAEKRVNYDVSSLPSESTHGAMEAKKETKKGIKKIKKKPPQPRAKSCKKGTEGPGFEPGQISQLSES